MRILIVIFDWYKLTSWFVKGKAVITFLDAILEKTLRSTVALIASQGRGKSAALGLAIVAGSVPCFLNFWYEIHLYEYKLGWYVLYNDISCRYSNIFVTAPSPENLKTLFQFIFKGFDALEYKVCSFLLIEIQHLSLVLCIHLFDHVLISTM